MRGLHKLINDMEHAWRAAMYKWTIV